jgi:ABC-2 type transport system permease protein
MSKSITIARRELIGYFCSPIAYVALAVFLLISGYMFQDDFRSGQPVGMRSIFEQMVWLLVFTIPVLSMGLIAQEWATGTIESMMTAPIGEAEVVMGKFIGALTFFLVLLAPTLLYLGLLCLYGRPDFGPIFSGYLGIVLVGALFISVGLFCSSLTKSQVVAAVASAALLFLITILPAFAADRASLSSFWTAVVEQGVMAHYRDFSRGVIDTGGVIFFLACTGVFLFFTVKVLESRRWQ